jgi:EmrB/QacA subfamily drug resistance transporter
MATVKLNSAAGRWVMVSTILASAMAFIDGTALNVVLPSLQHSLGAAGADLFWILNAYLLMLASLILIGGSLGDRLGRKRIFMMGICIFMLGSAASGLAPNVLWLIVFRMLQGLGGALMIPGSLSLISSSINAEERGKAIGTWSAATTVVTMGGPILGGALGDAGMWRFIFFINIPIGIGALLILWRHVAESRDEESSPELDIWGAVTLALGLASLTFGFLRMPAVGFTNWQAYGALIFGVLLLIAFIVIEYNSTHPMMPLRLFANPVFSGVNLLTFFLYAGLAGAMLFVSLDLVQVQGYSQVASGLSLLPFTILMVLIARYAGGLADRHGPRWLLIIGPALAGTALLMLSFVGQTSGPSAYWTTFFPGIFVFGLGMSLTVAPLTATVMASVSNQLSGTASGVNNALSRVSNVFANAIFGALAVVFFPASLQTQLSHLPLNSQDREVVMQQAVNLGNARVPAVVEAVDNNKIVTAYHRSFITAFANIMRIAAALCILGVALSFMLLKSVKTRY